MPGTKQTESARREQILSAAAAIAAEFGLRAVTIRDVAARAGLSSGLVLFWFHSKEQLLVELLDWTLSTTTTLRVGPDVLAIESPHARFIALLKHEMARLASEPERIRVFFEFWTAGLRYPDIQQRMKPELDRYRAAFRPIAAELIASDPERFSTTTPDALAAVAVSMVKGCAVQRLVEPNLNLDDYLTAAERLLSGPVTEDAL
jgi:TetR/AcrR family transcriptional repressor of bet genes